MNWETERKNMRENPVGFLRELAHYLEAHPSMTEKLYETSYGTFNCFTHSKEEFTVLVSQAGPGTKEIDGEAAWNPRVKFYPNLGEFTGMLCISTEKAKVCQRVQVGTKLVPASPERVETKETVIPASPEHEEPIYEWDCSGSWTAPENEEPVTAPQEEEDDEVPF